jgi:predicted DNA-binding transcriptional regulator YafY
MTSILDRSRVCDAISQRHLLRFRYTDNKTRVVEPHLVGESTAHNDVLVAWRLRTEPIDASRSVGWRNYRLDEMHSIEILEETFDRPRPDYNPGDEHILLVYCHIPRAAI